MSEQSNGRPTAGPLTHGPPDQEEDATRVDLALYVGIGSLVVFALGTAWAIGIQTGVAGGVRTRALPAPAIGRPEIGIVDQIPFDGDPRPRKRERAARRRLERWSWEDREHGIVRMPIDLAMDEVVRRSAR